MRDRDPRGQMPRNDTIAFNELSGFLRLDQRELVRLIETPGFPKPISSDRRGIWKRADIQAWIERARAARQQMTQPNPNGPRAA